MIQLSTNFKERILGAEAFESIFNGGRIVVFSGPQPASADHPVQGTFLGEITTNGTVWQPNGVSGGLQFVRSGAWASKPSGVSWQLRGYDTGVAGWFRLFGPALDTGGLTYAAPRMDGALGQDMTLESTSITPSTVIHVQQFLFTFPPVLGA